MDTKKRFLGILIPLTLLSMLSIYSTAEMPKRRPRTTQILDNPRDYENEYIPGMTGNLENYTIVDGGLVFELERYGRFYRVRVDRITPIDPEKLQKGDTVSLSGYSHLETKGYVTAEKVIHRPRERDERLYLLSYCGLALLLAFIIWDRGKIFQVIPIG